MTPADAAQLEQALRDWLGLGTMTQSNRVLQPD